MENIEVNTADLIGSVPVMEELAHTLIVHATRLTSRRERYRAVYGQRPQRQGLNIE